MIARRVATDDDEVVKGSYIPNHPCSALRRLMSRLLSAQGAEQRHTHLWMRIAHDYPDGQADNQTRRYKTVDCQNNIGYLNAKANATKTPLIPNRLKRQIPAKRRFHSLHTSSPSRFANPYSNEDISNRYTFSTHS